MGLFGQLLLFSIAVILSDASNIPCGKAFPCDTSSQLKASEIAVAMFGKEQDSEKNIITAKGIPDALFWVAAGEARTETLSLFNHTDAELIYSGHRLSPSADQFVLMHRVDRKASERARAAHVSVAMSKRLALLGLRERDFRFGVPSKVVETVLGAECPLPSLEKCSGTRYRSFSGVCNNVANPEWGASHTPFSRMLKPDYADGITLIRESKTGEALPPRYSVTTLFAHWWQFVASDMVNIVPGQSVIDGQVHALPCCRKGFSHAECDAIHVPTGDPAYRNRLNCLPHARSMPSARSNCGLGPREQANMASAFLDASNIYGNDPERARRLRHFRGGHLRTASNAGFFPDVDASLRCQEPDSRCLLSGSDEVNMLPGSAALHTLWVRQHNRVADRLKELNKHWSDDRLFDESRKIVSAQVQHITYTEFLPLLLGVDAIKKFGLEVHSSGFDADYDMSIEGATMNEFSITFPYLVWSLFPSTPLYTEFNNPGRIFQSRGMEDVIRTLLAATIAKPALRMGGEMKNAFMKDNLEIGLDLVSIALKQGRDHGIPGYTAVRASCGLGKIRAFHELEDYFQEEIKLETITNLYDDVADIDLLVGVMAEKANKGSLFGATMGCILGKQFQRTRRGDRFWYENYFAGSAFSENQLDEIRKTQLAQILCKNLDLTRVQPHVFMIEDLYENMGIDCKSSMFDEFDVKEWRDGEVRQELPVSRETIEKVMALAKTNLEDQKKRESGNIKNNQRRFTRGDPLFQYSSMMRAKPEAKKVAQISELLLETTKLLLKGEMLREDEKLPELDTETLQMILPDVDVTTFINNYTAFLSADGQKTVEDCIPKMLPCDHTTRYRSFSGWCNNLKYPHFANAFGPLKHLLPPVYDDGFDIPRWRAKSGRPLPNPRKVSNVVNEDKDFKHTKFTHMVMQFGQFLDHELTHSPAARGPNDEILNCTRCDSHESISVHCMPIRVEEGDPFFPSHYPNGEPRCLPFARSLLGQLNLGYRGQMNQLTAYIDASVIYGSTDCEAKALRTFHGGLLNFTDSLQHGVLLPQGQQEHDCRSAPRHPCFVAGDERNSHQPGLTMMHTLWMREHNRIAETLQKLNPHWTDEILYQETRRIVNAQMQNIVFNEFLPKIIGNDLVGKNGLMPQKSGYYTGYDGTCDASISQPFATAAFRFGHTLVRRMFPRMDFDYKNMTEPVDLAMHFGHVEPIYNGSSGGLDSMLMGLLGTPSMAFDRHITSALRNHLFMRRGEPTSGMDLIAINMLRARDHGVQPYNDFREFCGYKRAKTFGDLRDLMDVDAVNALQEVYESVDDIDLFPGLVAERPLPGALLGSTMSCLLAEQFHRLKKCDRFYYENDNSAAKFTPSQLNSLRKVRLASILCKNSKYIKTLQPNVFDMADDLMNAPIPCSDIPAIDLEHWKDRRHCDMNGRTIALGESLHITPCVTCTCTLEGVNCNPHKVNSCENLSKSFLLSEIAKDASCMIQCADIMKRR
ncbi:unnamed protein product, partial [Mesorhabditis belari]|uniref:Peroxidase n=1 Tax=Mesorhabditis belari TaxID=2138241 RepID=A0AAF3F4Z8_9BILA